MELMTQAVDIFNSPGATAAFKITIALRILCEGYSAIRAGGGLVGIYRGIVFGENMPRQVVTDYAKELKIKPKSK